MAECCCPPGEKAGTGLFQDCMLCGKPLVYEREARLRRCSVCGEEKLSDCACEAGHFVCDACHSAGLDQFFIPLLLNSTEKDPQRLLEQVMALPQVHLHGPEHHAIVPCVLLTAFHNCGGGNDLKADLAVALKRGKQVPGGACGYWGVCGAAAGAGIYLSVLTGSTPVNEAVWGLPQQLAARCLEANARVGGPRCCKRSSRLAIHEAVRYTAELFGLEMPETPVRCGYYTKNRECIGRDCPYFPLGKKEGT
ncbi:MAG: hypothetical protein K6G17_01340 [Oscillospiraceae bacterium]|nr:hypothetical protein [Oscillospiraceae bacterium]